MILVTGDDGADAEGLHTLAAAVADAGWEHIVFGNEVGWSAAGASLAVPAGRPAVTEHAGRRWRFTDSPPALMVAAACSGVGAAARPDGVLVGVNTGPNVGRMALHSGTVGGALTAVSLGIPAVAVSCDDVYSTGGIEDGTWHHAAAAALAVALLRRLLHRGAVLALNVNVPNLPPESHGPVRTARPADVVPAVRTGPDGAIKTVVRVLDQGPGTDVALLRAGHPTVTTLALPSGGPVRGPDPDRHESTFTTKGTVR
ncbi:MAG: 5'/3'-nucleotidase SurE [Pseudonocardia sp.]